MILTITEDGWAVLEQAMPRVLVAGKQLWRYHTRTDLRAIAALLDPPIDTEHRGDK